MKASVFQGPKGLKILVCSNPHSTSLTALVLVKAGTDLEKKENNGISHFIEHLYFKGTKNFPSAQILREHIDKIGGIYNAFTSYQYTGFYIKVLPEFAKDALFILSDILLNPLFPEEEIEKERQVIFEEINLTNDNPRKLVVDLGLQVSFGDQPAGWPILGTKKTLSKITREDILRYVKTNYFSKNTLVVLSGKIENSKELVDFIREKFSSYNFKTSEPNFKFKKSLDKYQEKIHRKEVDQAHIFIGFPLPGFYELRDRRYVFHLLSQILGGMSSSRLFSRIRDELSAAYYISSYFKDYSNRSLMVINGGISLEKLKDALRIIVDELNELKKGNIYEGEIEKAKTTLKSELFIDLEDSLSLALFYGIQYLWERKLETPQEIMKKIDEVNIKDIKKELPNIFNLQKTKFSAILPINYKANFLKIFKKLIK